MPNEDAALVAWVQDAEKVAGFLQWARGIPRNNETWRAERDMADRFLAPLERQDQQLAEPPQRALEWEMARQIEALEVKLAAAEAMSARTFQGYRDALARAEAAEHQLAAVRTLADWMRANGDCGYADDLVNALADPPRVAPVDRLSWEDRQWVEEMRERFKRYYFDRQVHDRLLAILDQHCPRVEPEGETT